MNYGSGIKALREQAFKMSMTQFALKTGMSPGDVFKYEENHEKITKKDAQTMCDCLDLPIELYLGLCVETKDIKPGKERLFDALYPALRQMILSVVVIEGKDAPVDRLVVQPMLTAIRQILNEDEDE